MESQVAQLQEDLKKASDRLSSSESQKKIAQQDAEDSKKQLSDVSSKFEESQKQFLELSATEEARIIELQKSEERDAARQSELEAIQKQHSIDSTALAAAVNEIQQLKAQLEMVAESGDVQTKCAESTDVELQTLKVNLTETLSLVETMKKQLKESKESESQAQALADETLMQLENAKRSVEILRADSLKAVESYNSICSELEQSRERVNLLEGILSKFDGDTYLASRNVSQNSQCDNNGVLIIDAGQKEEAKLLEGELHSLKSEVERLRSALGISEAKLHEEQTQSLFQVKIAHELVEQIKSESNLRETKLEEDLRKMKSDIEELKANLMDKETELQGISEENEGLQLKLEKNISGHREFELDNEVRKLKQAVSDFKANLMDKETELQNISEENEMLKLEVNKRETTNANKGNTDQVNEVDAAKAAEREALVKLNLALEEADKSNWRATRVTEQLEAAQAANYEAEAELRRLKVQSDQWRKAAEAAAAMLSAGNNGKVMERTGSLDSNYNSITGKINSPYDEMDDDLLKKKNGNVLKKIGVLWKKPQK